MTDLSPRTVTGTCAFRLMPTDELTPGASTAEFHRIGPAAFALHYTWTHPTDGPQRGAILVGAPDETGSVSGSFCDTWHQSVGLMSFTGQRSGDRVELAGTYMGDWGWTISVTLTPGEESLTMCNVVPESARDHLPEGAATGAYEVMVSDWAG